MSDNQHHTHELYIDSTRGNLKIKGSIADGFQFQFKCLSNTRKFIQGETIGIGVPVDVMIALAQFAQRHLPKKIAKHMKGNR
jgi:hypothetical protein